MCIRDRYLHLYGRKTTAKAMAKAITGGSITLVVALLLMLITEVTENFQGRWIKDLEKKVKEWERSVTVCICSLPGESPFSEGYLYS